MRRILSKTIENIQKGILEISQREAPFDVFICYKEADESGERTEDSVYEIGRASCRERV